MTGDLRATESVQWCRKKKKNKILPMLQCKAVDSALEPTIDCNKMKKETKMVARLTPMAK